jgi:hypothetical protein
MTRGSTIILGALFFQASTTFAAPPTSSERILNDFGRCRATNDTSARLACFEKTYDSLEQAVKAKDVTIVDKADMRQAKRSLFGFALPHVDLFSGVRSDPGDDFTEINTTVASAREVEHGRVEIRLADESGAVWQTTEPMPFPPRSGDKIRIRQATLGSYFLSTGGKSYRGMRVK